MVGSEALEVAKHGIANSRSLGRARLIPLLETSKGTPKFLLVILSMGRGGGPRGRQVQHLIKPHKVHFMGVVEQSKVDIPSNFIKFTGKVNNQRTHEFLNKPFIDGFLQCHKVRPPQITQQNYQIII